MSESKHTPDVLSELREAAARKWQGDPEAQRAGLFARAADELERLRADLAAMTADRDSWADQAEQRVADWDDEQRRCAGALKDLAAERRKVQALEAWQRAIVHAHASGIVQSGDGSGYVDMLLAARAALAATEGGA